MASHLLLVLIHYTHSPTCHLNFLLPTAESASHYAHFIRHMHTTQLLKKLSHRVRKQFTRSWKSFKQQIPFETVRKPAEEKCIMQPFNTTVIHKLHTTDCAARLNFVDWCFLGMQHTEIDAILVPHSGENCFQVSGVHELIGQQGLVCRKSHVISQSATAWC